MYVRIGISSSINIRLYYDDSSLSACVYNYGLLASTYLVRPTEALSQANLKGFFLLASCDFGTICVQ